MKCPNCGNECTTNTCNLCGSTVSKNNTNTKINLYCSYIEVVYTINRILFPPAKFMAIIWTCACIAVLPSYMGTFGQKVIISVFGYCFYCGVANAIYASNKKRYLNYKIRILEQKIKRLKGVKIVAKNTTSNNDVPDKNAILSNLYTIIPSDNEHENSAPIDSNEDIHVDKNEEKEVFSKHDAPSKSSSIRHNAMNTYEFEYFMWQCNKIAEQQDLKEIRNALAEQGMNAAEINEKLEATHVEYPTSQSIKLITGKIDPLFADAGHFIIEIDKASIGILQRRFRINFNRASNIMDQLCAYGVVSEEIGTAPRKILMSMKQYEMLLIKLKTSYSFPAQNEHPSHIHPNYDDMEGHDFEHFCADLLRKNDFVNVEVTQGSGDHGIDILAEKDDITYAIQCKCYSSNIGNAAIQQAHTGKTLYHRDVAVVMTNQYFTQQAKDEARQLGVKLWNRDKINELIEKSLL